MNYASFGNQFWNLSHYVLAFAIVFVLLPTAMFARPGKEYLDDLVGNYIRMAFFAIVAVYLLVILKLYELPSFLMVIVLWVLLFRLKVENRALVLLVTGIYDLLDGKHPFLAEAAGRFRNWRVEAGKRFRLLAGTPWIWLPSLLLIYVFVVSIVIRFIDPIKNAAPAMADAYVTIAWVKYLMERLLFHDGIYPQGLYAYMSVLAEFSFINPYYMVRYTGPVDSLLITFGLYYAVSRFQGQALGGIVAAALYGFWGYIWLAGWDRQVATESQEFGFVFVLPTLYFMYRYLKDGDWRSYWIAFAGAGAIGLTHSVSYMWFVIGAICLGLTFAVMPMAKSWLRMLYAVLLGIASGVISVIPIGIGELMGVSLNSAAVGFLNAQVIVPLPMLHPFDELALVSVGLTLLLTLVVWLEKGQLQRSWLFAGTFGLAVFALYYLGPTLTHSVVLATRVGDMWGTTAPFIIGSTVATVLSRFDGSKLYRYLMVGVGAGLVLAMVSFPAVPIIPYKMQWNEDVKQLFQISHDYSHQPWMIVAPLEENYALVLGDGYVMEASEFTKLYDPALPPLTRFGQHKPDGNIAPDVFIFYYKKLFEVSETNGIINTEAAIYARRILEYKRLAVWLAAYKKHHHLDVFYNGKNLEVFHIQTELKAKVPPQSFWKL